MTVVHLGHSVLPTWTAIGPPWVRPCRTPPVRVTSSCSKDIRAPRPWPSRRRASVAVEVGGLHLDAGRQALEDGGELLAVRLPGGQPAQHAGNPSENGVRRAPAQARCGSGAGQGAGSSSAATSARRMAAIGAACPVISSTCDGGLPEQHLEAADDRAADAVRPAVASGVGHGAYRTSSTVWSPRQGRCGRRRWPSIGTVLTTSGASTEDRSKR